MGPLMDRERGAPIVWKTRGALNTNPDSAALKFLAEAIADEIWASVVEEGQPAGASGNERDAEQPVK